MRLNWLLLVLCFPLVAACESGEPAQSELRGRVIDRDTGKPIPRATIAATYMGGVAYRGGGCNRVEGVVADADGWFTLPLDPQAGPVFKEAHSPGYGPAQSPRHARALSAKDYDKWVVVVLEWDSVSNVSKVVKQEPTIYSNKSEATRASREALDVYLVRFAGTSAARLMELQRLKGAAICGGGPKTTKGPIDFLDAIYEEQVSLGATSEMLQDTTRIKQYFSK